MTKRLSRCVAVAAAPLWTKFVDPFENAFSMAIPAGWTVSGGLLRHSPIDTSISMRVASPDMRTLIILGDPQVRLYVTPQRSIFGWPSQPEGDAVRNYLSGVDFARAYVLGTLAKSYDNLALTGQKPRPDLAQGRWVQFNPMARHDGGEATFACRQGGEEAWGPNLFCSARGRLWPTAEMTVAGRGGNRLSLRRRACSAQAASQG